MKKLIAFMLAALMVLSLAACGGDEPAPTTVPLTESPGIPTTAPATEPTTVPTTAPTTVPETTEAEKNVSKVGVVEGNTYTNTFLGITVTLGADWFFANDEEMAQIRGMTVDAMTDEKLAEQLETNGAMMDMYAMSSDGHSLNVVLENLNVLQSIALTEKAYAEATVGQLPAALESMGIKNVTAEITEMTFAGENHVAIKLHGILQDYDFYETLLILKQGNYMACITVGCYDADTAGSILEQFTAIGA